MPPLRSARPASRSARPAAAMAVLMLVAAWLLLPAAAIAVPPRSLVATVQRLADGDTLVAVTAEQTKLRLRLLGVDAPEIEHGALPGQPFGREAQAYLAGLVAGKTVRVDTFGPDRYKRLLAVVWAGETNVNIRMVAMGYAEVYRGARCMAYCRELLEAEAHARLRRLGMWGQPGQYESPSTYRQRMRLRGA